MTGRPKAGAQLNAYLGLRVMLQPLMPLILRRRVARGKDDPARWQEKIGCASVKRPPGTVIWVHAVGLGEVMALRPLLAEMLRQSPNISFVITSTARSSAAVIGNNLPANSVHQFLPLDGPRYVRRFLDHWQPSLSIWSEQDFWPGAIYDTANRGIPLAYINARITAESFAKRKKMRSIYRDLLPKFGLIAAQDEVSSQFLAKLGAPAPQIFPSLKPAAEPLKADENDLSWFKTQIGSRNVWVAASTHAEDEKYVFAVQTLLSDEADPPLLIIVPRVPKRSAEIRDRIAEVGLTCAQRSQNERPGPETDVYLADTFGELGLWYRVAKTAFMGASFGGLGGHNPWEPVCLGLSILHGPATHNFAADYVNLGRAGVAELIEETSEATQRIAEKVIKAILVTDNGDRKNSNAAQLVSEARAALVPLASQLILLMEPSP